MEDIKLTAKKRELEGTGNARRLRLAGSLPGIVYGAGKDPVSVLVDMHEFEQVLHHAASESLIIDVDMEGEGHVSMFVKDVQHHPVTSDLLHVDLLRVEANKPIAVDITIELVGESAGAKAGGILDQVMHAISVECLPSDLVDNFEVDVSALEIGQSLQVSDLGLSSKYKVMVDEDSIVAAVHEPTVEEEPEDAEAGTGAEPEVIGEKKDEGDSE